MVCAEPLDLSDQNFKPCQCGLDVSALRVLPLLRRSSRMAMLTFRSASSVTTSSCGTTRAAQDVVASTTQTALCTNRSTWKSAYTHSA
jgi:hypothetical protein